MAVPEEVIGIGVELQLAELRKQLASIPGLTADQAKLMTAELAKAAKASENAAKRAADATRKASAEAAKGAASAAQDFRSTSDDISDTAAQLGAGVGLISERAQAALQVFSDLADGLKGIGTAAQASGLSLRAVGAAVGVAAAAIAAAALAYRVATLEVERLNAVRESEAAIAASLLPSYRQLQDAQAELQAATGKLTEAGLGELSVRRAAQRAIVDYASAQKEARRQAYETIVANEAWANSQRSLARGLAIVAAYSTGLGAPAAREWAASIDAAFDSVTGWRSGIEDAKAELARLNSAVAEEATLQGEVARVTLAADKATRGKTAADKEAAAAEKKRAEAIRSYLDGLTEAAAIHREAIGALQEMAAGQRAARASELDRLAIARDAALASVALEEGRAASAASSQAATVEAQRLAADARLEIERTYQADVAALEKETTKKINEETQKRRDALASVATDIAGTVGSMTAQVATLAADSARALQQRLDEQGDQLSSSERKQLEQQLAQRRKWALAAFRISQGAAIASAFVSAGLASIQAYQSAIAGVPYPANLVVAPITAGAVGAAGAVQVAAIAAQPPPTFHTGLAPDEYTAKMRFGEGALTTQGVKTFGGADAVREANAGRTPAQDRPMQVLFSLDGRPVESALQASYRRGGVLSQVGPNRAGKSAIFRR